MSSSERRRLERLRPCPWPDCGKPVRDGRHEDGTPCVVTCPQCGAEVVFNIAGDCLDHPNRASWEACRDVVGGPGVFAQVAQA